MLPTRLWVSTRGRLRQRGARGMACSVLATRAKGISRTCFTAAACRKPALTWSGLRHSAGQGTACKTPRPRPRACRRPGPPDSLLSRPCQLLTSSRVRWKVQGRCFMIFHLLLSYNFRKKRWKTVNLDHKIIFHIINRRCATQDAFQLSILWW